MFVALVPPAEVVEHLDEFLAVRRDAAAYRWATAEQLHLTLAFLASVEERRLDELTERLARAAARRTAFDARVAGGGAFPNVGRARVLWAGLELEERRLDELTERLARAAARRTAFDARVAGGGAFPNVGRARVLWAGLELEERARTELDRTATGVRAAASRSGIAVDGQRFRPHITLARLKRPEEVSSWVRLLDAYAGPAWRVDRFTLVASHLGEGPRGRPRYEVAEEFVLGTRGIRHAHGA